MIWVKAYGVYGCIVVTGVMVRILFYALMGRLNKSRREKIKVMSQSSSNQLTERKF